MLTGNPFRREGCVAPPTRHGLARFHVVTALTFGVGAAACGGSRPKEADSVRAGPPASATPVPSLPECPNTTGRWDDCNVRQRLERAGLAPQPLPDTLRVPFLKPAGVGYAVGHAVLRVFLYDSAGALRSDMAKIDTLRVQSTAGDAPVAWDATPTLITSNNLAAILISDQATQIERVRLALTAGLPAPSAKK